jgi:prevent-host-death family protein
MAAFTIHEAKTNLSKLIARVEAGEEVVIMRGKNPVARLEPIVKNTGKRTPGLLKGKIPDLPDEFFFAPLSEEELRRWDEGDEGPR